MSNAAKPPRLAAYLESARVERSAAERWLLSRADNDNASRALVERLAGHRGYGSSSRTARLTVVSKEK